MQTFKINKHLEVVCESQNTRYGFRHLATLLRDGQDKDTAKRCYYNRTWERYEFESVLEDLAEKADLTDYEKRLFKKQIKNKFREEDQARVDKEFGTIASIAKLGELFAPDQKSQNDWKKRMLTAGLENKGLIIPEDWDTLDENDKQARLDGVIATLKA